MQLPESIANQPVRIVLVGFMGAGKSTVGVLLAQRLGWRFVDSDDRLEQKTGARIADLFSGFGEPEFRQMESQMIAELHCEKELVLALGGGALEVESTRRMIVEAVDTCVVFLKAPLDILIERCEQQPDAAIRPILNQRELLGHRFQSRQENYESADITIETHGKSPVAVVDIILNKLQQGFLSSAVSAKVDRI